MIPANLMVIGDHIWQLLSIPPSAKNPDRVGCFFRRVFFKFHTLYVRENGISGRDRLI